MDASSGMGFNEAGALTPRKESAAASTCGASPCFNEAGALTPRKVAAVPQVRGRVGMLQ